MPSIPSLLTALPLLLALLGLTALAFSQMWLPIVAQAPLAADPHALTIFAFCPAGKTPAQFAFFPWEGVNHQVCTLTNFFMHTLLSAPSGYAIGLDLACSLPAPLLALYLESLRPGTALPLRIPLLWLFLYQNLGMAVVAPLYYACLLLLPPSPSPSRSQPRAAVPHSKVEAVAFGLLAGFALPTAAMFASTDHRVYAAWQFFPLFVGTAIALYPRLRRAAPPSASASAKDKDSLPLIRTLYLLAIAASSLAHLYVLGTALLSPSAAPLSLPSALAALARVYLPQPLPAAHAVPQHLHTTLTNFFKWDYIFVGASTTLAGLVALGQTGRGAPVLLNPLRWLAAVVLGLALGAGAVMGHVWLLREEALGRAREAERAQGKEAKKA
ncbi:hypothetical protein CALCODRAFT_487658 [Calocera cornea HHB12733]|uniref:Uncharacterized protein n=1 Tax=Calocera cornea HHB12733 TaxID=1353952 RepID=A0A165CZX3_9BASI|nr:hypothetical protein CALCODRAFT_487658 [Calocera cornea HHB12733]